MPACEAEIKGLCALLDVSKFMKDLYLLVLSEGVCHLPAKKAANFFNHYKSLNQIESSVLGLKPPEVIEG